MKIMITYSDGNAAFEDNGLLEHQKIFVQVLTAIEDAGGEECGGKLRDTNGNTVGYFSTAKED